MSRVNQLGQIVEALTSGAVSQVRSSVEEQLGGWDDLSGELRERYEANLSALLSSLAATKSALTSMAAMLRQVQGTTTEWKLWQTAATAWKTLVTGLGLGEQDAHRMQLEGERRTKCGTGREEYGAPILIPVLLFGGTVVVAVGAVAWAWAVIEIAQALQGWVQAYNQELMARVEAMRTGKQLPDTQLKTPAEVVVPKKKEEEEGGSLLLWLLGAGVVIGGGIWAISRRGR
ncbi:MAG TPA: hypothetical protein PLA94_10990 [Myxococcota bacterium]|nr:hypothetical protein [Myxococcota bacterium]